MTLKASLVAKVVTKLEGNNLIIGTAYPIRTNTVITAYHVIPDLKQFKKTTIKWVKNDLSSPITNILYSNRDHDVVVLECETPEEIPAIDICRYSPDSTRHWDSMGFANAGIDHQQEVRNKTPAGGQYIIQSDESCEMHLQVASDAAETALWRGMSGAPVFTVGTNQLTGVISKVPDKENPDFKDRIYATSMARLRVTDPCFEQAVSISINCQKHTQKYQSALLEELEAIKCNSENFYRSLEKHFKINEMLSPEALCETMLAELVNTSTKTVEKLRLGCEPFMASMRERCELLLIYLLASKVSSDEWSGDSLHDLAVKTRMLCELKLSSRYQVRPQLMKLDSGEVAGTYAIHDHSSKEVGFDPKANAKEQAKAIAYYIYRLAEEEYDIDEMEQDDWKAVDEALATKRKGEHSELVRLEINAIKESNHPLASEDVRRELYKLLPALPVVLFGSQSEAEEKILRAQVRVFYERMQLSG